MTDSETSPDLRGAASRSSTTCSRSPAGAWSASVWTEIKSALRSQAADPDSEMRRRLTERVRAAGARLHDDPALAAKVQDGLESAVGYVAEHFNGEIATLVSGTIERWDAEETSRRLELLLGPDLQYIRINGTVVGGLAGLALHTIATTLH